MSAGDGDGARAPNEKRRDQWRGNRPHHGADRSQLRPRRPLRGSLPVPLSSFVGRDGAKEEVIRRLQQARLVTVVGPGGAGKTRLVLEVAAELDKTGQRVTFVDLAVLSEQESVVPAVAAATGVAGETAPSLLNAVVGHLGGTAVVVVLDNCEHLRAGCAETAEALLGACGGLRILATSRERLGTPGEVVWRIPPLSLPEAGPVLPQSYVESEAVQLFCERAAALRPGFLPTPDDMEAIVEICRRLDGNALAIELAAARVAALPPAEIAARLDDRLGLLEAGASTAAVRHRSLRGALEWSYQLLSRPEQALLRRASVFPGSFGLDAAEAVCPADDVEAPQVPGLLTSLVDKSLVVSEFADGAARFRLLDTVRAYAAERLEELGRTTEFAERHAQWCLALVEAGPRDHGRAQAQGEWLARVETEMDSLRAALEWALAHHHAELALRLVQGQMRLWERRGCFATARERLERVLSVTEEAPDHLRAAALHDAGFAALVVGDLDAAEGHLRASVELSLKGAEPRAALRTRTLLAFVATFGDDPASVEVLEHAAAEVRATGDDALLAEVLAACGQARMFRGEPGAARRHFDESLQAARRAGLDALVATALVGLGSAEVVQGDYPAAEEHLQRSVLLAAAAGDAHTEVAARIWLAELADLRGGHEQARNRFEECLTQARATGAPYPVGRSLLGLGRVLLEGGDPETALALFEEAATVARSPGLAHLAVQVQVGRGQAALALGDVGCARERLEEALALARRRGDKAAEALALEGRGQLSRRQGDLTAAVAGYRQALTVHAQVGDPSAMARCLEALATLAAGEDDFALATRLLGAAASVRDRHGCARTISQRQEHTATVETLRQASDHETFEVEWRRAKALSIEEAVERVERGQGRRGSRPARGWDALTGAERTVAELAARGRTNAEIARELQIAGTTVKAHLRRVFAKLGVQTRSSLAAEVHGERSDGRSENLRP